MTGIQKIDVFRNKERLDLWVNSNGLGKISLNELFDFTTHTFYEYTPITKTCNSYPTPAFNLTESYPLIMDPTKGYTQFVGE